MKINEKILQLVKNGFKATRLTTLSESQINTLHKRLVESKKETKEETQIVTKRFDKNNPADIGKLNQMLKNPDTLKNQNVEVKEGDPELSEKFESKKQQKYFFAKCGEGKTKEQKKWCKMADEFAKKTNFDKLPNKKTETNEDGTPVYQKTAENLYAKTLDTVSKSTVPGFTLPTNESELERKITRLVEKHISPKMSKQDFINTIKNVMVESPEVAPVKTPTREKEKEREIERERRRKDRDDPFRPGKREQERPAPRAEIDENELPDWLTSKSIGI